MARHLLIFTNILNVVRIDKLVVPELVEGSSSDVILDCQYTVPDDNFTLEWLINNASVYKWSPHVAPKVSGLLNGRLDLSYRIPNKASDEHRTLRIINLTPDLIGNYTCKVESHGVVKQQTKSMLIYSFEREFDLFTKRINKSDIEVSCYARGIYPRPDLTIEYNEAMVSGQLQRVWRNEGWRYDAMCHAHIKPPARAKRAVVVCRLNLPDADYTAIRKKIVFHDAQVSSGQLWTLAPTAYYAIFACLLFL